MHWSRFVAVRAPNDYLIGRNFRWRDAFAYRIIKILTLVLVIGLAAVPAWGENIDLLDSAWAPASGLNSYTVYNVLPGLDVTISASGGAGRLWWDSASGFGVKGSTNDEIDKYESILVSFSQPVTLNTFEVYNLFNKAGYWGYEPEKGKADLSPGPTVDFQADFWQVPGTAGFRLVSVGLGGVNEVSFYPDSSSYYGGHHGHKKKYNFSLGGLDVTVPGGGSTVPEPGTLLLVGSALVGGLGVLRRRRAARS
ncbi:MAG: PEP-CTERM sorting domain-containing protein [Desulfarculaceae bacterium]|nr:PEP-CTERM sorting domain-containing protein [Desulfarculaceae bacterium]MCF8074204.1 PEP-CTERM sorting domain-containing protein [Desulfarculaceae bacterium]MCF8102785.1 PEP-CTERM sorting domain-containing protein [Desulfarculaceae bacterium]MCF8116360.1 PEP-CTERM sorting domain-containing protein [Desulfarculaceae bacterium]